MHFSALKPLLRRRLLITGYHGDKVWAKDAPYLSAMLVRGDMSGMALTEFRLSAGFIHCPIAFFGARQVSRIKAISNSREMLPWDTGGHYSRPICRRVIEEAGLPRDAFGTRKSYASRWFVVHPDYMTAESIQSYLQWLRNHRHSWLKRGSVPPSTLMSYDRWRTWLVDQISKGLVGMPGYYRWQLHKVKPFQLFANLDENEYRDDYPLYGLRRFVMPWAVEEAKRLYYRDRSARVEAAIPDGPIAAAGGTAG